MAQPCLMAESYVKAPTENILSTKIRLHTMIMKMRSSFTATAAKIEWSSKDRDKEEAVEKVARRKITKIRMTLLPSEFEKQISSTKL